jgi:hypothetical protein
MPVPLHAFALRQLMKRRANIGSGKGKARVADDWEERFVVRADLARILKTNVKDVKKRLAALAAAWETAPGVTPTVDPPLLGALAEDKGRYLYVLRAELVFDLNREMGSDPSMLLSAYRHVVVDEYQDLNLCDVAVIDEMVFAARSCTWPAMTTSPSTSSSVTPIRRRSVTSSRTIPAPKT